jgi:hypothetical protein
MSVKPNALTGRSHVDSTRERYILAMWLLFRDIDDVPPKSWERLTPYSIAQPKMSPSDRCNPMKP